MTITAIKAQVKNPDRVSIFIDGKYSFSLTYDQLLEQKVRSGLELDEPALATLKKVSDFGKAYGRILNYIAVRPRSIKEVKDYCWRKQISPEDCAAITDRLVARGYLNDAAFARMWVESRRLTKAISKQKLQLELRQKGITEAVVTEALAVSEYRESDALQDLIAKKSRQSRYQDSQKLLQYLMRQGFRYDEVREALVNYPDLPETAEL